MDREVWAKWRDAPEGGVRRRSLEAKLLKDNEALAQYYVAFFARRSSYYIENMRDDLLQASRIGIIRALKVWDPDKGGFSAVAFRWALHEMQQVVRHASGVSVPKSAFLPRAKQDEIARFQAKNGREPTPEEVGLTAGAIERSRKAAVEMMPVSAADDLPVDAESPAPEEAIDRKRDHTALQDFIGTLSKKDRKEFWTGARDDLTARAKAYVESRRSGR